MSRLGLIGIIIVIFISVILSFHIVGTSINTKNQQKGTSNNCILRLFFVLSSVFKQFSQFSDFSAHRPDFRPLFASKCPKHDPRAHSQRTFTAFGHFKLTNRPILYAKLRSPIHKRARANPIVRTPSSRQRLFITPKMCSIRQRTFDFTRFIAFCDSVNGLFR